MTIWQVILAFVVAALVFWFGSYTGFPQPWLSIVSVFVLLLVLFGDRLFANRI